MARSPRSFIAACTGAALTAMALAAMPALAADNGRARVIVAFKAGGEAAARAAIAANGGRVLDVIEDSDALAVSLPRSAVAALRASRTVDYVEDDLVRTILGMRTPVRTNALPGTPQTTPYGITQVQADQVSGTPTWTPKICIVDSGIDATHEDLAGNVMSGKNFSGSGSWNTDEDAHGTHVAGTIAALNNSVGVVGVGGSKQFKLIIAKVFDATGSASSSVITKAINYCGRQKANIISMSLGSSGNSRTEQRALDKLQGAGVLLVAAAGNSGDSTLNYPAALASVMSVAANDVNKQWASFSTFNADVEISAPGVAVLSTVPPGSQIGASTTVGGAGYTVQPMAGSPLASATGPLADFGFGDTPVPGSMTGMICLISRGNISFSDKVLNCQNSGGIGAIVYNNTAGDLFGTLGTTVTTIPSVGALQADGATMLGQLGQSASVGVFGTDDIYAEFNGTSMATPHVSGVAGLVWSYHKECTAEQIRSTLKLSALDIGDAGRDDKTGAGLVQAKTALDRIAALGCGN